MKQIQTSDDIRGLWAAIPMPWTQTGALNVGKLRRNVERLARVPCDGVYSTDSDGEFYALEIAEFREFIGTFAAACGASSIAVQAGVTWTNTQGIVERTKVCLDHGITALHICYPYWMPLNRDDVARFWEDLAEACPAARWIHYNTPRGHVVMDGADYRRLAAEYPEQLIGTKLGTQNYVALAETIGATPQLAHMVTDFMIVPGMLLGARGSYSFWVNTLPRWHRELINLCSGGKWQEASIRQGKFNHWEATCVEPLVRSGYLHGIVGKARGAATGFLEDDGWTRAPYQPVPAEKVRQLVTDFERWWHVEAAAERFPSREAKAAR